MEGENASRLEGYPSVVSYEFTKKIINQMENSISKISIEKLQRTGFFCKIPFPNNDNKLPVFITNNHVIKRFLFKSKEKKKKKKLI